MLKEVPGGQCPGPDFQTVLDNSATTHEEALSPNQQILTKEVDLLRAQLTVARTEIDNLVRAITALTAAYASSCGQSAERLTMENQKLRAEVMTLTAAVDTLREERDKVTVQQGFYRCCYCLEVGANSPEEAALEAETIRRDPASFDGIWDVYAMREDGTNILPPVTIDTEQLRDDDDDEQEST